jgi:hypothetical protein
LKTFPTEKYAVAENKMKKMEMIFAYTLLVIYFMITCNGGRGRGVRGYIL